MNKTSDTASARFERGPAIAPADRLIAWLGEQRVGDAPRLVRLPVVLAREALGFSTRGARIGDAPDAVVVDCDDSALGIGLAQQARARCADGPACALWLAGYWRPRHDGIHRFEVVRVDESVPEGGLATAHAEVEAQLER